MSVKIEYLRTHEIRATVEVVTGLRVGAGRETIEIGGVDNPVIRHPHTQDPYLPGSSVKGKLRSLLEWATNSIESDGGVWGTKTCQKGDPILRIFGTTHKEWKEGPSRLVVRDAALNAEWKNKALERGLPLVEDKSEVTINRLEGKAASMGPRTMERVPAGASFELEMLFKEYAVGDGGSKDRECLNLLIDGLKLLEQDALGGSGSRGYGKVKIKDLKLNGQSIQEKFEGARPSFRGAPTDYLGG